MLKLKHLLWGAGILGTGIVVLGGGKTRAASGPKPPQNLSTIDGKLTALQAAGSIALGGTYIIVAADEAHWDVVSKIATARARANPQFEYRTLPMALARELAADRGYVLPAEAWGGVASISDAELRSSQYFSAGEAEAEVTVLVQTVEGTIPALESEGAPGLASIVAGLLPASGGGQ